MPYPHSERLVRAFWQPDGRACNGPADWYNQNVPSAVAARLFTDRAGIGQFAVEGEYISGMVHAVAGSVYVGVRGVSPRIFSILGVRPKLGRALSAADDRLDSAPAVVLSYRGWRRIFGLAASALGKRITLAGVTYTVVGIMSKDFLGADPTEGWIPVHQAERFQPPAESAAETRWVDVVGRVRANLTFAQASEILEARSRVVRDAVTPGKRDARVCLVSMWDLVHPPRSVSTIRMLYFPLGVLIIATLISVFLLWVGRNSVNQQGMNVMVSLGASRWLGFRSRISEPVLTGVLAAVVTGTLTIWEDAAVQASQFWGNAWFVSGNISALAVAVAVALASGMIVIPAIMAAMGAVRTSDRNSAAVHGAWARTGHGAMRRAVAIQSALAVVVLAMGLAPAVELARLQWADLGFDAAHTLLVTPPPAAGASASSTRWRTVADSMEAAVRSVPGVTAQGVFQFVERRAPVSTSVATPGASGQRADSVALGYADAGFFEALAIRPIAGRLLSNEEMQTDAPVAVISATASRRLFRGTSPLGQTLTATASGTRHLVTVIGVVPDVALIQRSADAGLQIVYSPAWRDTTQAPVIYAQTGPSAASVRSAAEQSLGALGATPGASVQPWGTFRQIQLAILTLPLKVMSFLVLITWITAAMGLYGLVAYTVERRLHELGIRSAVGATQWQNARLIGRWIAMPVVFGAGIGVALSLLFAAPLLTMLHFGSLSAWMPLAAAVSFCGVAILAGLLPAIRGLRAAPRTIMNAL